MIETSMLYDPYSTIRHIGISIKFGVIDVLAKETAVTEESGSVFGNASQTVNEMYDISGKYTDLTHNMWVLDGSMDYPAEIETEIGWWSSLISNENGEFLNSIPYIEYFFSQSVSTMGWMLYFDKNTNEYPSKVRITVYDISHNVIDRTEYTVSGTVQKIESMRANYYSMKIEFLSTNIPYRRVRFSEIDFGLVENMNESNVGEAEFRYGVDITGASLPAGEISFTFDNSDKRYNLLDPDGLYEYLQEGQGISASLTVNSEKVDMGAFYFASATASASVLIPRITGYDIIYALDGAAFRGGSNTESTLGEAIAAVIGEDEIETRFFGDVASRTVSMAVPGGTSRREAIRMFAQAAMCNVWTDRWGVINFAELLISDEASDELTPAELYDFKGVSVTEPVDGVVLEVNNIYTDAVNEYRAGEGMKIQTVSNPCVADSMGQAVAAWLLERFNWRKKYAVKNRGNPALEHTDTIRIHDIFDNKGLAIVTGLKISYNGALSSVTEAVGKK